MDQSRSIEGAPAPTAVEKRNDAPRSTGEVRSRLEVVERQLQHHVRSLRKEMTFGDINVADAPVLDHVRRHPFLATGVAAGSVALITLMVTLLSRSRPEVDDKEQWIQAFLDDLLDDAASRLGEDGDADIALRKALRRRAPVIVLEAPEESRPVGGPGFLGSALLTVVHTALGMGVRLVMDAATQNLAARMETERHTEEQITKSGKLEGSAEPSSG
jgi:ElaB/YqjD/DUF883 family membrane-anchored ribosome-binding protein